MALKWKRELLALVLILTFAGLIGVADKSMRRPLPQRIVELPPFPPPPTVFRGLDPPAPGDPAYKVKIDGPRDSRGTAFPIHRDGHWMTARHVVDSCDRIGILSGRKKIRWASAVAIHANADLAVFSMRGSAPLTLPVDLRPLERGQKGFGFGFPNGKWAQLHTLLLGRARQHTAGRYRLVEPVLVWSVHTSVPSNIKTLGGISGGPMLDTSGTVIGVHSASSRRRGRLMTVAPITLLSMLNEIGLADAGAPRPPLDVVDLAETRFPRFGDSLRRKRVVVPVVCDVF